MASLRKFLEDGVKAYLDTLNLGATVFTGHSYLDKTVPAIIAKALTAEEEPFKSGNFRVTFAIDVRDAASATSTHDDIVDALTDAVFNDAFKSGVENAGQMTIWDMSAQPKIAWETDGDCWVDTLTIEFYCCPRLFNS